MPTAKTVKTASEAQPHLQAMYDAFNQIMCQLPEERFMKSHPIFDKHAAAYEVLFNFLVSLKPPYISPEMSGIAVSAREDVAVALSDSLRVAYANIEWPEGVNVTAKLAPVAKTVLVNMLGDLDDIIAKVTRQR